MYRRIRSILTFGVLCSLFSPVYSIADKKLEAEIAREYQAFGGHSILGLKQQPCKAIQFVYHLQEQLYQEQEARKSTKHTADKIAAIISEGAGVGGINTSRQASEDERKIAYSALYEAISAKADVSIFLTNESFNISYSFQQHYQVVSAIYQINQEDPVRSQKLDFLNNHVSYNNFVDMLDWYLFFKGPILKSPVIAHSKVILPVSPAEDLYLQSIIKGRLNPAVIKVNSLLNELAYFDPDVNETWDEGIRKVVKCLQKEEHRWNSYLSSCPLSPVSLGTVEKEFSKKSQNYKSNGEAKFYITKGVDAKKIGLSPFSAFSVCQLASQFNFLESPGAYYVDVSEYLEDMTQGPQGSLGSLAALIVRDYSFKPTDKQQSLQPLFSKLPNKAYKEGYLMLYNATSSDKSDLLNTSINNIGKLNIFPQWGRSIFNSDSQILQVCMAAPSFQGKTAPKTDSDEYKICEILVSSQYKTVAQLAILRYFETLKRVSLHLTLVGQGAFNNPTPVLKKSLEAIHDTVKGWPIDVFIHGYGDLAIKKIKDNLPKNLKYQDIKKEDFFSGQLPVL